MPIAMTREEQALQADAGWRLSGQKVWTSLARQADWAICLARTDPDVPKHDGITYFLVDMHAPGIDIGPLREITGRTSQEFLLTRCLSIAGGTAQILLTQVAERVLGLPR